MQIFEEIYRTKYQQQFEEQGIWWVGRGGSSGRAEGEMVKMRLGWGAGLGG